MTSKIIQKSRFDAFQKQFGRCYYCEHPMWLNDQRKFAKNNNISLNAAAGLQCTAEHLIARSAGGGNSKGNIVAAHRFCNQARHRRKNPFSPEKQKEHVQKRLAKGKWLRVLTREEIQKV